jgi:glucokinase
MVIGIEIGGTKLQLVSGETSGRIVERRKLTVIPAHGAEGIRQQIAKCLAELLGRGHITAVGVGFGGPVDWKHNKICRSHQIEGWSEFDLGGWLGELSRLPVRVDNDANVAALGEATLGAGKGSSPVFYITLGSGVGGGLVVDGRVYHGATPGEAEIGHVRLDPGGTTVESRCSGWAVDARIRDLKKTDPASFFCNRPDFGKGGEARHLAEALRQRDRTADRILAELVRDVAFGLSHVVHLFHPEVIAIGGGLSGIGEPLRNGVEHALTGFIMEAFHPGPRVALAALGEDAVTAGALLLAGMQ